MLDAGEAREVLRVLSLIVPASLQNVGILHPRGLYILHFLFCAHDAIRGHHLGTLCPPGFSTRRAKRGGIVVQTFVVCAGPNDQHAGNFASAKRQEV